MASTSSHTHTSQGGSVSLAHVQRGAIMQRAAEQAPCHSIRLWATGSAPVRRSRHSTHRVARRTQRGVQHSAVLRVVDVLACGKGEIGSETLQAEAESAGCPGGLCMCRQQGSCAAHPAPQQLQRSRCVPANMAFILVRSLARSARFSSSCGKAVGRMQSEVRCSCSAVQPLQQQHC